MPEENAAWFANPANIAKMEAWKKAADEEDEEAGIDFDAMFGLNKKKNKKKKSTKRKRPQGEQQAQPRPPQPRPFQAAPQAPQRQPEPQPAAASLFGNMRNFVANWFRTHSKIEWSTINSK